MWLASICIIGATVARTIARNPSCLIRVILGDTLVAWQLQLRPIAAMIALCKHHVKKRGLTKPQVTSVLRLSSRMLSYLDTSGRPISLYNTYEVSCHILCHSPRTWFGFDITTYFNLWCHVKKCFALDASSICLRWMLSTKLLSHF